MDGVCGGGVSLDDILIDGGNPYAYGVCDCEGNSHNYGMTDFPWQRNYGPGGKGPNDPCSPYDAGLED